MGLFGRHKNKKNEAPVEDAFSDELLDMQVSGEDPLPEEIYGSTEIPVCSEDAEAADDSTAEESAYEGAAEENDTEAYEYTDATETVQSVSPAELLQGEDRELFFEQFAELMPIDEARNNDICDKFVMSGIADFGNGFDTESLGELDFGEFCHVYNTVEWYVTNVAPDTVYAAVAYKRYLRMKLLERICQMTVYTVISSATHMPYTMRDGSMLIFTDSELAQRVVQSKDEGLLEVCEITPESFDARFCEYYCAGFTTVKLNVKNTVHIGEIYRLWSDESYGNTCKDACVKMVAYKQALAFAEIRANAEGTAIDAAERKSLIRHSLIATAALFESLLMLPVGEDGNAVVPVVSYGGGKYVALFTDSYAMCTYYKKSVASTAVPNLIRERYRDIADIDSVKGFVINPGREEFVLTKKILRRILGE